MSGEAAAPATSERLDKWLWSARACRTRAAATRLVASGAVRVNGTPAGKAHQPVRPGDVVTFPQGHHVRVWRVVALAARRQGPALAQGLYEDLKPPTPENRLPAVASSPAPPQRPDSRARRQLRALREQD